jgi:signal transduction histidine kinase
MTPTTTEEHLKERIKELTCLYDITTVILQHAGPVQDTLAHICTILQKAYKYDAAVVELRLDVYEIVTAPLPDKCISQHSEISVDNLRGSIAVHYPSPQLHAEDFLAEEQMLLNKVAVEIALFYQRLLSEEKEQLLQRSMQRADRLAILGEITAGIAHELNTPLGNILGYAELINQQTGDGQISNDASKIINAAIHSREIVKKLMFFSCEMPQHKEFIEIAPVIEQALSLLGPNFSKKQITANFSSHNNPITARLDSVQFTQVLFNILLNAIYASPEQGSINVLLYTEGEHLYIEIADEGQGVPQDIKAKIFEPFFTTKPMGEGTGLGLSVVHGIVKGHGGEIKVMTNKKGGATFQIQLPLK